MGLLLLVRHGQASFGEAHYDRLSELGAEQSRLLGARLAGSAITIDRFACGTMQRQIDTLAAMGQTLDLSSTSSTTRADLDEYDHVDILGEQAGAFTFTVGSGNGRAEANRAMDGAIERWARGEGSYAETYADFVTRVSRAVDELAQAPGTTVAVSSGGAISAMAAHLLGLGTEAWLVLNRVMANGSITKVVIGRSGRSLVTLNDHAHLEHERRLITYR